MKQYSKYMFFILLVTSTLLTACQENTENFDNKIYIDSADKVTTLLLKGNVSNIERTLHTAIPKPAQQDINLVFKADIGLVDQYNQAFYDSAVALPDSCFELPSPNAVIQAGGVKSTAVSVSLKDLDGLDRDVVYVLPVTIEQSDITVLESARTAYYVIKGAALINTVANVDLNKLSISWSNAEALNNLSELTIEGLVYVEKFDKLISTIMGIEGNFLVRAGDAGIPDNQIQLATSRGNVTDASWTIPVRTWTHFALTYDTSTGAANFYINGLKRGNTQMCSYRNYVHWGNGNFWIGRSYDDNRYLSADVSEYRIWNRVLTVDEINARNHFYTVESDAEGLAAYWKFDEGAGMTITDHTANGNHAKAANNLTWKPVELPLN